jgi:osmoprotectant transport system substrate-binding protein
MKKSLKNMVALTGASLLVLAGCAADSPESPAPTPDGQDGPAEVLEGLAQYDLSGITVTVGSKDFAEQLVLGEIMVAAFEAAGATVNNQVDLGGTNIARSALESGDIDIYMEYNGTGWGVHLGIEDAPSFDPDVLTAAVAERDLAANEIVWVGQSPFNNTYGFVSSPELTESNGGPFSLQTMMEYVRDNPDAIVCLESEYPSRPDGLILMETATGINLPVSQQRVLDTGIVYTETAANNCEFGEVYTTDGRIPALNLTLVDDPGVHFLYNVSGTMRLDKYNEAPEAFDAIINAILSPLDNNRMADLNTRLAVDGQEPAEVALAYLLEEGLITG